MEGGDDSGRFDLEASSGCALPTSAAALDVGGVVEPALAEALMLAARAGQWGVVAQLAAELEARRVGRGGARKAGAFVDLVGAGVRPGRR